MGLHVYVGPLSRYYSGTWETIVEQAARVRGIPLETTRMRPVVAERPERIHEKVVAWKNQLGSAMSKQGVPDFDWDESLEAPYFTDRPDWDGYAALLLWGAYEEHPELQRPEQEPAKWQDDPALKASLQQDGRYPRLLRGVGLWLPCEFPQIFRAPDPRGVSQKIASSVLLYKELLELNQRTWRATPAILSFWREDGMEQEGTLEDKARFAFAVFHDLTKASVEYRLPMKLDY